MTNATCEECQSSRVVLSTVPGMLRCRECGNVFVMPDGVTVEPEAETVDTHVLPDEMEVSIPDAIEVQTGWRSWSVPTELKPGEIPLLSSITHTDAFWTPRRPMQATCGYGRGRANGRKGNRAHQPPMENCSCGLYSAKTREHLLEMRYHAYDGERNGRYCVIGKVKVWGGVIEGSQGWRSEFGYPEHIYVPYEAWKLAEPIQEAYGCDVELDNFLSG